MPEVPVVEGGMLEGVDLLEPNDDRRSGCDDDRNEAA